jgi:HEAT repeat protein
MKRLMMCVALSAFPIVAAAQVAPPPPPSPVPVPPPAPAVPMVPPLPPLPAVAPMADVWHIDDLVRQARDMQHFDAEAMRHAVDSARDAAEQARFAVADALFDHNFDFAWDWDGQARVFPAQGGEGSYSTGLNLLTQYRYEPAIAQFDRVIAQKGSRADAAMYHKAFAQFRLGRTDDALATIAALRKDYPQSRYLTDAKVLEADVRKRAGQPVDPNASIDDEIKLLAIQAMQHSDPARAIPLLEGVLNSANSPRVKRNALYVLALSTQPRAREILVSYAKGAGNPDVQIEAIRYIATSRDRQATSAELRQIYESTQDVNVRMAVINAYRSSGDRRSLVSVAGATDTPVAIRSTAISGLSTVGGPQDLFALYQKETSKELKLQLVSALGSMQALEQLNQVIRTEKDPEVRRSAVRALGRLQTEKTGAMLVDMYGSETDLDTRRAVISALTAQHNAEALVAIARKETSLELKRDIVKRLSDLAPKSKVAADFLMELINK